MAKPKPQGSPGGRPDKFQSDDPSPPSVDSGLEIEEIPPVPLYRRFEVLILAAVVLLGGLMWLFFGNRSSSIGSTGTPTPTSTNSKPANLTEDQAFVYREYDDILGAQPTPAELSAASAEISSKGRTQLIDELLHRQEFVDQAVFVGSCYLGLLGREPDYGGWTFWLNNLRHAAGASQNGVILTLLTTPEYQSVHGNPDPKTQYQEVCRSLYGKPCTEAPAMAQNRGDLLRPLLTSPQAQGIAWQKLFGYYLFFTQLKRMPAPAEVAPYRTAGGNSAKEIDAIADILRSPEYRQRAF